VTRGFHGLAKDWEALGDADPLYGVLSDPAKSGGKWDAAEFLASGQRHVEGLLRTLADARAGFERGDCLDFGCGVGRLTIPLAGHFRRAVGVDVAASMIERARQLAPPGARVEFVVNRAPDLRGFRTESFDVVHSCLVLQHVPPENARRYIAEFFRVCRSGGLVVFQLPARRWTEADLADAGPLPDSAFAATIELVHPPAILDASAPVTLWARVTNRGDTTWRQTIPAGRHICLGDHWLREDGVRVIDDDGRARLPKSVGPGEAVEIAIGVRAPEAPGRYLLELDLVQEHVAWFAHKGSPTARALVTVTGIWRAADVRDDGLAAGWQSPALEPRTSLFGRLRRRLLGGMPRFEMHVVPRSDVEEAIRSSGGVLLQAVDDNAAGPGWQSFTYICRKEGNGGCSPVRYPCLARVDFLN
jgi:SAM-dependent methyltransferase